MVHDAAIQQRIRWSTILQFTGEPVFEFQMKIGEWFFIIQMSKLVIEFSILVVAHFNDAIFYPKCVAKVFADIMMVDLNNPVINIPTVKNGLPTRTFVDMRARAGTNKIQKYCDRNQGKKRSCFQNLVFISAKIMVTGLQWIISDDGINQAHGINFADVLSFNFQTLVSKYRRPRSRAHVFAFHRIAISCSL